MTTQKKVGVGALGQQRRQSAKNAEKVGHQITNEQLMEDYAEQLETGDPVIFFMYPTDNPDFVDVYLAQMRPIERAANVNGANGPRGLSKLEIALKGFDSEQIVRHRDVYNPKILADMGWKEGMALPGTYITINDSLVPRDDIHAGNPRANRQGFVLLDPQSGDPIYRHTNLVSIEEGQEAPPDFVLNFEVSDTTLEAWREEVEAGEEVNV